MCRRSLLLYLSVPIMIIQHCDYPHFVDLQSVTNTNWSVSLSSSLSQWYCVLLLLISVLLLCQPTLSVCKWNMYHVLCHVLCYYRIFYILAQYLRTDLTPMRTLLLTALSSAVAAAVDASTGAGLYTCKSYTNSKTRPLTHT